MPWGASRRRSKPYFAIRAALDTDQATAALRWEKFNADGSSATGELAFDVIPDGAMRDYVVDAGALPEYRGRIRRISVLPRAAPESKKRVVIESIGRSREYTFRNTAIRRGVRLQRFDKGCPAEFPHGFRSPELLQRGFRAVYATAGRSDSNARAVVEGHPGKSI